MQVLYPHICSIELFRLGNLRWIWDPKIIPNAKYMEKLVEVKIDNCGSLEYIFPKPLGGSLLQLRKLSISHCGVKEIVWGGGAPLVFP